jgi:hypothetical protein
VLREVNLQIISNTLCQVNRARICKRLWSPEIASEESIQLAYVAGREPERQIGLSYRPARLEIDSWETLKGLQIAGSGLQKSPPNYVVVMPILFRKNEQIRVNFYFFISFNNSLLSICHEVLLKTNLGLDALQ